MLDEDFVVHRENDRVALLLEREHSVDRKRCGDRTF
jgi:hypothetical protein